MTEHDLIQRAKAGDRQALDALYHAHAARVYSLIRRLTGDDAQAEDAAQETWLRAIRSLPAFRAESRFSTWIHRIAVNCALYGRRSAARIQAREVDLYDTPAGEGDEGAPLLRMRLQQAIDALPTRMRRVLVLHDIEGYTHEEIGALLGVTPGTSKSQLFKARAKLREQLRPKVEGKGLCSI